MKKLSSIYVALIFFLSACTVEADLPDFRDLVKETSPAVVNISTVQHAKSLESYSQQYGLPQEVPEIFRHFFGSPDIFSHPQRSERTSLGSGFIISKDGYILTNNHVIQNADEIVVRLSDRRELDATLIGADETTDVALLKVEAKNLPTVALGDSEDLEVGEWVVAIGSPFGFDHSVTAGIVSAKGRSLPNDNYVPFIQTDVAINPGNSGGPLFNLDGKVVGINSQIYTRSGGFMGVSFAIPINVALEVSEQLKDSGRVSRGWLGVLIQEVNKDLAESFGLSKAAGALLAQVMPDGPASKSDLRSGDVITHLDGKPIVLSSDLPQLIGRVQPGSKVTLQVMRNGKKKKVVVEVGQIPEKGNQLADSSSVKADAADRLGVTVSELTARQRQQQGAGVVVQQLRRGAASDAGIMRGDIITMIDHQPVGSVAEFNKAVANIPSNKNISVRLIRRGNAMFVALKVND